jgi:hypothetical protein
MEWQRGTIVNEKFMEQSDGTIEITGERQLFEGVEFEE